MMQTKDIRKQMWFPTSAALFWAARRATLSSEVGRSSPSRDPGIGDLVESGAAAIDAEAALAIDSIEATA